MGHLPHRTQELTAHWPLINAIAGRRFADGPLAEEAALYVLEKLEEENGRRLQSFSGRARLSTFISVVSIRLLEDFARKKFGRVRPPGWIVALGGIWISLFQLLCLQRLSVVEALETLKPRIKDNRIEQLEEAAWTILEKEPTCGRHQGLEILHPEVDGSEGLPHPCSSDQAGQPEQALLEQEKQILLELLLTTITGHGNIPAAVGRAFAELLEHPIEMTAHERLLLKLCFQDGLPVTKAGSMLGLNANQVHGRLRRLLARLRDELDRAGIGQELREMLHGE